MGIIQSHFKFVGSQELSRCELVALLPIKAVRIPLLPVEVSTFGCIDQQLIGLIVLSIRINVVCLVTDLRNQGTVWTGEKPVLPVELVTVLAKIYQWTAGA